MNGSMETNPRKPRVSILFAAAFFVVLLFLILQLTAFIAFELDMAPVITISFAAAIFWIAYTLTVLRFNINIYRTANPHKRMTLFRAAINTLAASAGVFAVGFLFFYPLLHYAITQPTGHFTPYIMIIPLLVSFVIVPLVLLPTTLSSHDSDK